MSTSRNRRLALVVVIVQAGCASPVPDQPPSGLCEAAPAGLVTAVSAGLVAGTSLTGARMVRDPEREDIWLVAAELDGPGIAAAGEIGVWATDRPDDQATIYSVDAFALQFSDWPRIPDPSLSERASGAPASDEPERDRDHERRSGRLFPRIVGRHEAGSGTRRGAASPGELVKSSPGDG